MRASVPPDVLEKAANLFRVFGEDYHEQKLEEVLYSADREEVASDGRGVRGCVGGPAHAWT